MSKKKSPKSVKLISAKQRAADGKLRALLRNADLKKLDRALERAIYIKPKKLAARE